MFLGGWVLGVALVFLLPDDAVILAAYVPGLGATVGACLFLIGSIVWVVMAGVRAIRE